MRIMVPSSLCSNSTSVAMQEEEPCDYLEDALVTPSHRTEVIDWMYTVVDRYRLDLEVVVAAVGTIDHFLSKPSGIAQGALRDRKQFELVAVAALDLCLPPGRRMTLPTLCGPTGERIVPESKVLTTYAAEEIQDMASHIRRSLSPELAPTSTQMARHLLSLALPGVTLEDSRWMCVLDDVRFQTEHAARDYFFATRRPRAVAVAAVLNALDQVTGPDRREVLRAFPPVLREHCPSLADVLAARNRLRAVMERDADDTAVSDAILKCLDDPSTESPSSLGSGSPLSASVISPSK